MSTGICDLPEGSRRRVFFYRDYRFFTGGHLKVWHYYCHTLSSPKHDASLFLTPSSTLESENPWQQEALLSPWCPDQADVLFLAGLDWQAVDSSCHVPVINLIQHVRHAHPNDPRFAFLSRPATRICVSPAVADAILASGRVNGPVHVIANGLDLSVFPSAAAVKDIPILLVGMNDPFLASELSAMLHQRGVDHVLQSKSLPRPEFLTLLGRSRLVVLLPSVQEGFYLPALEAMALGCLVICPDCIGNRHFCLDGINSFRPKRDLKDLLKSIEEALSLGEARRTSLLAEAAIQVHLHDIAKERQAYLSILDSLTDRNG